jgi:hypothetical protein
MASVGRVDSESGVVKFRPTVGEELSMPVTQARIEPLLGIQPWRTFKWHKDQKNYLGAYWSATERKHLIYESRHELAHLMCADFDRAVTRIATQPFRLDVRVNGKVHHHVPDFLLLENDVPVVVDVTWPERLVKPKVAFLITWTRTLVEAMDCRYEVLTGVPETRSANVRFLAGYRRDWLINGEALGELRSHIDDFDGKQVRDVQLESVPSPLVRRALLHMLWNQESSSTLTKSCAPIRC